MCMLQAQSLRVFCRGWRGCRKGMGAWGHHPCCELPIQLTASPKEPPGMGMAGMAAPQGRTAVTIPPCPRLAPTHLCYSPLLLSKGRF